MRFEFNGKAYQIDFRRHGGVVPGRTVIIEVEVDGPDGTRIEPTEVPIPTRYPYTTATLYEVDGKNLKEVRTATVGSHHKERFTLEKGRLVALRALFPRKAECKEQKDFKATMWRAYTKRPITRHELFLPTKDASGVLSFTDKDGVKWQQVK